jgi:hypothetical protein
MNTSCSGNSGPGDNLACLTNESQMLVFTEYRDRAIVRRENSETSMAEVFVSRMLSQVTPPILQQIVSLPPARIVKIFEVRERLAEGKYDIDERLDAVLDRLLADINT